MLTETEVRFHCYRYMDQRLYDSIVVKLPVRLILWLGLSG